MLCICGVFSCLLFCVLCIDNKKQNIMNDKEKFMCAVAQIFTAANDLKKLVESQAKNETEKAFLTINQAAELLGITVNGVYRLTHLKKIAYYKPTGKKVYFKRDDINAYLQQNRVKTDIEEQSEILKVLN